MAVTLQGFDMEDITRTSEEISCLTAHKDRDQITALCLPSHCLKFVRANTEKKMKSTVPSARNN
jgi:hypothetical protein